MLLWLIGSIITILIILLFLLQTCWFQNFIIGKATAYLSKKLQTTVSLDEINITFPKKIYLKNFYIADQKKDTLLFTHELTVDINMAALFKSQVIIQSVSLDGSTIHIYRLNADSSFNFDFITDAFSSSNEKNASADSTALFFSLANAKLRNIFFTLNDETGGFKGSAHIGDLDLQLRGFDLGKEKISIKNLTWNDSYAHFSQTKISSGTGSTSSSPPTSSPFNLQIFADQLQCNNLDLAYSDTNSHLSLKSRIGLLNAIADTVDIGRLLFSFDKLNVESSFLYGAVASRPGNASVSAITDTTATEVVARSHELRFKNFDFRYDDKSVAPIREGMDYSHLYASAFSGSFSNVFYSGMNLSADIHQMMGKEKSGLNIHRAYGKFRMTSNEISLDSCLIVTDRSTIRNVARISYPSLGEISSDPGKLGVFANLTNASIAVNEILYFYPPLRENEYIRPSVNRILNVDGVISGTIADLHFNNLRVNTANTDVWATGSIEGLPDVNKLVFDINFSKLSSGKEDLMAMVPENVLPSKIEIPSSFNITGTFTGSLQDFKSAIAIQSSMGNGVFVTEMKPLRGRNIQQYDSRIELENFDLGAFLKQEPTIGKINLSGKVRGEGYTLAEMNTTIDAEIRSVEVKGYNYRHAVVDGKISGQSFTGNFSIADSALALTFHGKASLDPDFPAYDFTMDVKHADLKQLNFYKDDLQFTGKITGDFTGNNIQTLNGTIHIQDAYLKHLNKLYPLDSIILTATSLNENYVWTLRSGIVDADYNGTSTAAVGIPLLINHFNYYFNKDAYHDGDTLGKQTFDFDIRVHDRNSLLPVFIPGLESLHPFEIKGNLDGRQKMLNMSSTATSVVYNGLHFDSIKIAASSDPEKFNYSLLADKISRDTISIRKVSVSGFVRNDSVHVALKVAPDTNRVSLLLGGTLSFKSGQYRFGFNPGGIVLQGEKWSVPNDNYIYYSDSGLYVNDLKIVNGDKYLFIRSDLMRPASPLTFSFSNFDLSLLSKVIDSTGLMLSGMVNGDFYLEDFKDYRFTSALKVNDLSVLGQQYGSVDLKAKNEAGGRYDISLAMFGKKNDLKLDGYYVVKPGGGELNLGVTLDSLNFALIEPFTQGYIKHLNGSLKGSLRVSGTTLNPKLEGVLHSEHAGFILSYTNAIIVLGDDPLVFDAAGIHFNQFRVHDIFNNPAVLNGDLLTNDYRNFQLALDLHTDNFIAMSSNNKVNKQYFGIIRLDSDCKLRGTLIQPSLDIKARLRKGTNFTYVYINSDTSLNAETGIVEFINHGAHADSILVSKNDSVLPFIRGYDITASLDINDESEFKVVIDPAAGDQLSVRGNGFFNYNLTPEGRMSLTGRYEISGGGYSLTLYNLVKKQFILDKGGSITWNGEVMDAYIDFTGHLPVRTPPLVLIGDQVANTSETEMGLYKTPLDFNVFLKMQGRLLQPTISFDIQLDDKQKGALGGLVDAKLAQLGKQEGEMNKQVFALLVFGTFIPEDPLTASTSTYLNDVARSSVSRLMSNELNKISGKYIKGFDLNFDLRDVKDYSSGVQVDKTQLNVGFREKLFNERLQIYVGTNFDIGGGSVFSVNPSSLSGDLSLEYLITLDGRLRLNVFRRNSYGGIFEDQTIETGASLAYNRDYERLSDLFRKKQTDIKQEKKKKKPENPSDQK